MEFRQEVENRYLPEELVIEILTRLPVKSLMRFKSVSKFFYSLITSDHHFKHKHYEISRSRSDCVIFARERGDGPWLDWYKKVFGLVYKESDCDAIGYVDLVVPSSTIREMKCIDGILLCVTINSTDDNRDFLIWNPSTREIKALPPISPPENFDSNELVEVIGFGFCNNMTGKVVTVWAYEGEYKVMVCSQVGNVWGWRQINPYPHFDDFWLRTNYYDIYLKGKYYWYMYTNRGEELKHDLLWFDMSDEIFGMISLPTNLPGQGQYGNREQGFRDVVVSVMNDTIALMGYREARWEFWLMKENNSDVTWHKCASLDCNDQEWEPVRIWDQGRHLLVYLEDELVSIDLVTEEKKRICNIRYRLPEAYKLFRVYSESLKLF